MVCDANIKLASILSIVCLGLNGKIIHISNVVLKYNRIEILLFNGKSKLLIMYLTNRPTIEVREVCEPGSKYFLKL